MTDSRHPSRALLGSMLVLMTLGWGFNFIAGKVALRHMDVATVVSFRLVLAGLIMFPIYLLGSPRRWPGWRDWKLLIVLGLLGVVVNQGLFTAGLSLTTVGHSSFVVGMGPILVLTLASMLGLERPTAGKVVGMALAFAGLAVLAAEHGPAARPWEGDLVTLGGTTGYAFYAVLGKRVASRYDSLAMNTYTFLVGAIFMLPLAVHQGRVLRWGSVGWAGWAGLFFMAAISSVAAYLIFFWALRYVAASRIAAFSYLLPVYATLLGIFLLGEHLTVNLVAGGALVLAGIILAERGFGRASEESVADATQSASR